MCHERASLRGREEIAPARSKGPRVWDTYLMSETLFPVSGSESGGETTTKAQGSPRLVFPNRAQMELRPIDLESLLPGSEV
jgi:hypothetical protein